MSWLPGVGPVQDVSAVGISRGLSADWYSDTHSVGEIKKGSFWDVIDNPLYEAAAGAMGLNWADWVADARTRVPAAGSGGEQVRALVRRGRSGGTYRDRVGRNSWVTRDRPASPDVYEVMSRDEAEAEGYDFEVVPSNRWRNKETGEIVFGNNPDDIQQGYDDLTQGAAIFALFGRGEDGEDEWEELFDWGVGDEGLAADLDGMQGWLKEIVNINNHLPDIIREGPKGEHYGIEGDIWEHYGLDKEPEVPKEMDWDSAEKHMVLSKTVKSTEAYSTPEGITPIDLHGD